MTSRFARPEIYAVPPAVHGSLDRAELAREGLDPSGFLDFSVNGNPYGPAPGVEEALRGVRWDAYPDRECWELRGELSARLGVAVDRIVAGNGAAELIHLAASAFLDRGDRVLVAGPTFGEYARASRLRGAPVAEWRAREEDGFLADPAALDTALLRTGAGVAFLCNPNNPTGCVLDAAAVADLALRHETVLFVVDEAYLPFAEGMRSALEAGLPNVLVLRSLTKDCALAGLRLGYAAGPRDLVEALEAVRPPWNVNAAAQAAGVAALRDDARLRACLGRLREDASGLWRDLAAAGMPPVPTGTHYALVRAGERAAGGAAAFRRRLMEARVLVRDGASFGLPEHVRIASRTPEDNARLVAAVAAARA